MASRIRTARKVDALAAGTPAPIGVSGYRVVRVGDVNVEVHAERGDQITLIAFPVVGCKEWAVVSIGRDDGSEWTVGGIGDGWQHDTFPTIQDAVTAVVTPAVRRQILARTARVREIGDLERRLRDLRAVECERPAGAIEQEWPWAR